LAGKFLFVKKIVQMAILLSLSFRGEIDLLGGYAA
jgi:hypothetical protein